MTSFCSDLKEREEAIRLADLEFYRVKREKLYIERAKRGCSTDDELRRDAINRASAAASRAKLVYLVRDLEVRTERLEYERNVFHERSMRMFKRLESFQQDRKRVQNAIQALLKCNVPAVHSILTQSNFSGILHLQDEDASNLQDYYVLSPLSIPIKSMKRRRSRRSPAVDATGLRPCSPIRSPQTEVSSSYSTSVGIKKRAQPTIRLLQSRVEIPRKRVSHTHQQVRFSAPSASEKSLEEQPKGWYDAVRDVVRIVSSTDLHG